METKGNTIIVQTERKLGLFLLLLVFVVGAVVGFYVTKRLFRDATKMVVVSDTTYIHDTTRIVLPSEIKYIKTTDTLLVMVTDTLMLHDTTYVVLQKEEKEYRGEDYYAKVSGYRPSLDIIEVYPKTTIINNTLAPKKNNLSLGIDVGYIDGFRAPIYLEYKRQLSNNFSAHGRLIHDLPSKTTGLEVGGSIEIGW